MVVLGGQLDLMILEVFSSFNDSVILGAKQPLALGFPLPYFVWLPLLPVQREFIRLFF